MKKDKKQHQGKDPISSVKTPQPPQVMDPSKSPSPQTEKGSSENVKGKIKKSASTPEQLAPKEEL
jgi:hypothetical protein